MVWLQYGLGVWRDHRGAAVTEAVHADSVQREVIGCNPIVSGCVRSQAGRVRRAAILAVRTLVLKLVLGAIERISRNESVHVDRSNKFPAAAALVSQRRHKVANRFVLRLEVERIYVGAAGVGQSPE
jgi:hypothetical protein